MFPHKTLGAQASATMAGPTNSTKKKFRQATEFCRCSDLPEPMSLKAGCLEVRRLCLLFSRVGPLGDVPAEKLASTSIQDGLHIWKRALSEESAEHLPKWQEHRL